MSSTKISSKCGATVFPLEHYAILFLQHKVNCYRQITKYMICMLSATFSWVRRRTQRNAPFMRTGERERERAVCWSRKPLGTTTRAPQWFNGSLR